MSPHPWPGTAQLLPQLLAWASTRRWFPLRSGPAPQAASTRVVVDVELAPGIHDLVLALPRAAQDEATGPDEVLLHVPLVVDDVAVLSALTGTREDAQAAGFVLEGGASAVVDAPHHPAFWQAWARAALAAGSTLSTPAATAITQRAERLHVTTGEQSNTSVILPAPLPRPHEGGSAARPDGSAPGGARPAMPPAPQDLETGDLIVKLFRVLAPGRNPDVEVSVALARSGWDRVRTPVAWSTLELPGAGTDGEAVTADSAVATTFVPQATDGFELFCALAGQDDGEGGTRRRLTTELARDLGATTARMHEHLASSLGTSEPVSPAELRRDLQERARWALAEVPALQERLPGLAGHVAQALDAVSSLEHLEPATRVHGDYHLGQTLHEDQFPGRWYVLDFEGEPLRPLADRRRPDQPLRDVAGMLRSFDYAAAVGRATDPGWLEAVREAFSSGYREVLPCATEPGRHRAQVLLTALELDKALYEAVYEARHRPAWLEIPVAGIRQVIGTKSPAKDSARGRVEV
ncbi:phosphotransferase [Actinomyces faecalis]|uniref:phosphotransferase n=1 Tax=Actinomyces faecalis TaxID=2722820 RepID=UPI001554F5AC|nr:phosphotransferase [Actinomyces faecalis]